MSFDNTKTDIVESALGKAISLSTDNKWNDIVNSIKNIANRGAVSSSLNCGGSYTIPAGYHNGSGKITANSLFSQVTNRGAWTGSVGVNGKTTIPEGYHDGSGYISNSVSTMGGQTVTPNSSSQTVYCSGKYMTGNITINAIPNSYFNPTSGGSVFRNGSFGNGFSAGINQYKNYLMYTNNINNTSSLTKDITSLYYSSNPIVVEDTAKNTICNISTNGIRITFPSLCRTNYLGITLKNSFRIGSNGAKSIKIEISLIKGLTKGDRANFYIGFLNSSKNGCYCAGTYLNGINCTFTINISLSGISSGYYWLMIYREGCTNDSYENGYIIKSITLY